MLRLAERITAERRRCPRRAPTTWCTPWPRRSGRPSKLGCEDLMAFATSAVRDADNAAEVLARVRDGDRRRAEGADRHRRGAADLPRRPPLVRLVGGQAAGARHRRRLAGARDGRGRGARLRAVGAAGRRPAHPRAVHQRPAQPRRRSPRPADWLAEQLAPVAKKVAKQGEPDRVVATSKTFRSLARLTGAAPSSAGPRVRRVLTEPGLRQLIAFISRMSAADLAELEGVSPSRAAPAGRGGSGGRRPRCARCPVPSSRSAPGRCGRVSSCGGSTKPTVRIRDAWRMPHRRSIHNVGCQRDGPRPRVA